MSLLYFLLLLSALIVVHELGHFMAAKMLNFKVIRFSLGFGRALFRVSAGETQYQIGWLPLGGYVRIAGEDPHDELPEHEWDRAFFRKPVWQRTIVIMAGPLANLLLPIPLYFIAFAGDTELPGPVIGDVTENSPAETAGLKPGDVIINLNGEPVEYWLDVERSIARVGEHPIDLTVRRGHKNISLSVVPEIATRMAEQGTFERRAILGIVDAAFLPQIAVPAVDSPAAKAGLRTGDIVMAIDGVRVDSYRSLLRKLAQPSRAYGVTYLRKQNRSGLGAMSFAPEHTVLVTNSKRAPVSPPSSMQKVAASLKQPTSSPAELHGIFSKEQSLAAIDNDSPAERAGLKVGDILHAVAGHSVSHWVDIERILLNQGGHSTELAVLRASSSGLVEQTIRVQPRWVETVDEYQNKTLMLAFGGHAEFVSGAPQMTPISGRFSYAASHAFERSWETIGVMASGLFSLIRGKSPADDLAGPITMFQVAATSGAQGWETFLLLLALVSVSVGLLNLLPIPVLDGGHLLIILLESIVRRPISFEARQRASVVGLALVSLVTVVAIRNDLVRYLS